MADLDILTRTVRDVVAQELAPARIVGLTVRPDLDYWGDDILRIDVVVEAEGNHLDPKKVIGLGRHLREPLERLGEGRFPIFTFLTPGDLRDAAA